MKKNLKKKKKNVRNFKIIQGRVKPERYKFTQYIMTTQYTVFTVLSDKLQ